MQKIKNRKNKNMNTVNKNKNKKSTSSLITDINNFSDVSPSIKIKEMVISSLICQQIFKASSF